MSKFETMIVSYEENVNCIGTTSHFIGLSGHLRVSLTKRFSWIVYANTCDWYIQ